MKGFVLTACQRKGGVGRSTLFYNLAGTLAKRGLKVLILDLDPQASISQICLGPEIVDTLPAHQSIVSLLDDAFFGTVESIVKPSGITGVDLVPGSNALEIKDSHVGNDQTGCGRPGDGAATAQPGILAVCSDSGDELRADGPFLSPVITRATLVISGE